MAEPRRTRDTAEELQTVTISPVRAFADTSDVSSDDNDADAIASAAAAATTTAGAPFYLHVIKWIALAFIALCVLVGSIMSKVTFVSIAGRMYTSPDEYTDEIPRSLLFIQLTISLVIPEAISVIRCLVSGVIGKTTESYPWPSKSAFFWVS